MAGTVACPDPGPAAGWLLVQVSSASQAVPSPSPGRWSRSPQLQNLPAQFPVSWGEGAFLAASVLLEPRSYPLRKPENKHSKTNILLGRLTPAGAGGPQLAEGVSNLKQILPGGVQELPCCRRWRRTHTALLGWHSGLPVRGRGAASTSAFRLPLGRGTGTEGQSEPWRGAAAGGFHVALLGAGAVDACGRPVSAPPSLLPPLGLRRGQRSGGKPGKKCQGRQGHDSSMPPNAAVKQWALGNSACRIVAWDYLGAPLCCSCTKASHLAKISSVSRHCS